MQKAILVSALTATLFGCGVAPKISDPCAAGAENKGYLYDSSGETMVLSAAGEGLRNGYWKSDFDPSTCTDGVTVSSATSDGVASSELLTNAERGDVEQVRIDSRVLFGFDSAVLTDAGKLELDLLLSDIQALNSIESILVVGHTDSVGSASYNQMLSERRATSVRDYIAANLSFDNVSMEGRGEKEPIADNSTAEGRERNRRVEVFVDGTAEDAEQLAKAPVENKISQLIKRLTGN